MNCVRVVQEKNTKSVTARNAFVKSFFVRYTSRVLCFNVLL